jgi:dextranase
VVSDDPLVGNSWSWTAPETDYTGYVVDLYTKDGNSSETIYATVGVDVSSDWTKFPRYGFVATYTADKTPAVVSNEMAFLNRCHINGVQFYDWHNKHHWPLGGTRDNLLETYKDIANRTNVTSVIKNYISVQHSYGMKSMFYNLCYGALKDAAQDGVSDTWYSFKDESHNKKYVLTLSSSWKSNIYLMDPANADWQNYIAQRNDDVYANFDFDGYHVDQIGDLGTLYDYYGSKLNMPAGYASFLRAMKTKHPNKSLVMNAVSNYGAENIASTGDVDFMYTEVWGGESKFSSLHSIIKANDAYSNNTKNTVFAAYMDYGYNGTQFNDPGVLLTDAVIFSLGGDHLELGDHMLCHEYFANNHLEMSDHLKSAIVKYYDFLTAYQNLLRGGGYDITSDLASGNVSVAISSWPPKLQTVTAYSKMVNHTQVIHLLNFRQASSLSWRDMNADMPEPEQIDNLTLRLKADGVKKIWVASPDTLGGAPQELSFNQNGGYVEFTVPSLKYWTMIVVEK